MHKLNVFLVNFLRELKIERIDIETPLIPFNLPRRLFFQVFLLILAVFGACVAV